MGGGPTPYRAGSFWVESFLLLFLLVERAKIRRARFTASESSKSSATSGSRMITLLPSGKREAYFPRTPELKSYSGRISETVLSSLSFFIGSAFCWRRQTRIYDSKALTSVGVSDHEESAAGTHPQEYVPRLPHRVFRVRDCQGKKILEGCDRLRKGNPVFPLVVGGFDRVPLEEQQGVLCLKEGLKLG